VCSGKVRGHRRSGIQEKAGITSFFFLNTAKLVSPWQGASPFGFGPLQTAQAIADHRIVDPTGQLAQLRQHWCHPVTVAFAKPQVLNKALREKTAKASLEDVEMLLMQ
jgi:hypothetical protein